MRSVLCVLFIAASALAGEIVPLGLEGVPLVVAEVNGRAINRQDLVRELIGASGSEAISRLVRRMLVEQAATAQNISVSDDEIEQQYRVNVQTLKAELVDMPWNNASGKTFSMDEIIAARYRMSVDEYKKTVVRQSLLVRRIIARDLTPTDEQLLAFFNAYPDLFQPPVRYHASHILISPFDPRDLHRGLRFRKPASQMQAIKNDRQTQIDKKKKRIDLYRDRKIDLSEAPSVDPLDEEWKRARLRAEKVLAEIKGNLLTWDQAVRKYTQDPLDHPYLDRQTKREMRSEREQLKLAPGDVGFFTHLGPLVPEFHAGARNLRAGEIGGPVQTEYGYHLIRMIAVQEPPRVAYPDVRDKVMRLYLQEQLELLTYEWMGDLTLKAELKSNRTQLWPPAAAGAEVIAIGIENAPEKNPAQADPVAGTVNGAPLKRSEVWRELVRADGEDALNRLINLEIIMTMLKPLGLARMEWEIGELERKEKGRQDANPVAPPPAKAIKIRGEDIDRSLTEVRLQHDREGQDISFRDFVYQRYGQTIDEYKRSVEAGLVLREAMRRRINVDDATLQVQFAMARDHYAEPAWYELSHILIVPTGGMDKADKVAQQGALTIADYVYKSYVKEPGTFKPLVQEYSMDSAQNKSAAGKLGACYPYATPELPDSALFYDEIKEKQKLERGQVSTPIKSRRGYHIIRVDAVHAERQAEFRAVRDRLERDYLQERAKMYSDVWLRSLHSAARIKKYIGKAAPAGTLPPDTFPLPKDDDDKK